MEPVIPKEAQTDPNTEKFNPFAYNMANEKNSDAVSTAKGILMQADLLQREANTLRAKAYSMAPSLQPRMAESAPMKAETKTAETKTVSPVKNIPIKETEKVTAKKRGRPKTV
jgi:hypothetical protein